MSRPNHTPAGDCPAWPDLVDSPLVVFASDRSVEHINPAAVRFVGADSIQTASAALLPALWPLLERCAAARANVEREPIVIRRPSGCAPLRALCTVAAVHRPDGTVERTIVSLNPHPRPAAANSKSPLEALAESIDGILWELDLQTFRFTYVNGEAERLLGYPLSDWFQEGFWVDHLHPDDRVWATEFCIASTEAKRDHDFEYRMVAADGRVVWLRDVVTVVLQDGEPVALRGVMVNTTERRRAEEERNAHIHFLESLDVVNRAIQSSADLDSMVSDALGAVLEVLACDRAFLAYPCDPDDPEWNPPIERTRPEWLGVVELGMEVDMDAEVRRVYRTLLDADGPVSFGPSASPLPENTAAAFHVRSMLATVLYSKVDKPYMFGIHQCSHAREWTPEEVRLFREISRRMEDGLTSRLIYRALRESENRYRTLVQQAPDGIFIVDGSGRYTDVNASGCRMLGYNREELLGVSIADVVAPEEIGRVPAELEKLKTSESVRSEWRFVRKDGSGMAGEVIGSILPDGRVLGTVRDISERRQMESALRGVLRNARTMVMFAKVSVADWNPSKPEMDAHKYYWDNTFFDEDAAQQVLPLDVPPGASYRDYWGFAKHPDDIEPMGYVSVHAFVTGATDWQQEFRCIDKHGKIHWMSQAAQVVPEGPGRWRVTTINTDITEKRQAEQELRESEARFRAAVTGSSDGLYDADLVTGRVYFSPRLMALLGFEGHEDEFPTNFSELMQRIHPDERAHVSHLREECIRRGAPLFAEYRMRMRSGEYRWFQSRGDVQRDAEGRAVRLSGFLTDVTERIEHENRLRDSLAQMRALAAHLESVREEERTRLSREVHDELGQAMTAIKLNLYNLAEELTPSVPEEDRPAVAGQVTALLGLVDQTVDRVRRIATELRPPLLDTLGLVPALEWQAREFGSTTGIRVDFNSTVDSIDMEPDRATSVLRIFQESLTNVARHANATLVSVRLERVNHSARLTIRDNGRGFDPAVSRRGGSLGLVGMRERAMVHGGDLQITSANRRGTRIKLTMPLVP